MTREWYWHTGLHGSVFRLAVGELLVLSETPPKTSTETPIQDEEKEPESPSRLRYHPQTGEYTCDAVDTVETGNLRIKVHLYIALEDGTNVPDCFELSHTGFIVYRGETKLIEFDAEEAYIKERQADQKGRLVRLGLWIDFHSNG